MAVTRTQAHIETTVLGTVDLYREELEQIVQAVAEVGEPSMKVPGFVASEAADLADPEMPEKLTSLVITASPGDDEQDDDRGSDPEMPKKVRSHWRRLRPLVSDDDDFVDVIDDGHSIRVSLERTRAVVQVVEPDTHLNGVVRRIEDICQPRRRRIPRLWSGGNTKGPFFYTALVVVAILLALFDPSDEQPDSSTTSSGAVPPDALGMATLVGFAVLGAVFIVVRSAKGGSARLVNAYRADRPSFWRRNRDSIWITTASLVVGAVLGIVANEVFG